MTFQSIIFYAFAAVLIFSALRVITAKNPVYAVLFLVLSFYTAAALWMLLYAEFLAITLIIVYVGAVMVLFLFVVMMLDVNIEGLRDGFWKHFPVAALVGVVIALELALVLIKGFDVRFAPLPDAAALKMGNTKLLGIEIYTKYLYPLQIAAVLLLVAIIAAIALTLRKRKDAKGQNPSEQVKAKKADRMRIVQLKPQVELLAPAAAAVAAPTAAGDKK